MQTLLQNLRFSLRMLARNPGLTITVLLTLRSASAQTPAIVNVLSFQAPLEEWFISSGKIRMTRSPQ